MTFTITAPLFRILVAVPIFLLGCKTCNVVNRPVPLTRDLSTVLSNQSLILENTGHSDVTVATAYVPVSLHDHGRSSVFWCGLLALACAGAYIVDKAQHHISSQLLALDQDAKTVPKGGLLKFYIRGLRNLNLTGWVNATGARDTFMAWMFSLVAVVGVGYSTIATGLQNLASDKVSNRLQQFVSSGAAANNAVFGNSGADGSYTLERWTCQIAPLVSDSADMIKSTRTREILNQSCRDGQTSRLLLLTMLPLAILMLLSIAKPQCFTFTFGAEESPAWMTVPLEENDKDETT